MHRETKNQVPINVFLVNIHSEKRETNINSTEYDR